MEYGASVNIQDVSFLDLKSPLHKSLDQHHWQLSSWLIYCGADLTTVTDRHGRSCKDIIDSLDESLQEVIYRIPNVKEMSSLPSLLSYVCSIHRHHHHHDDHNKVSAAASMSSMRGWGNVGSNNEGGVKVISNMEDKAPKGLHGGWFTHSNLIMHLLLLIHD